MLTNELLLELQKFIHTHTEDLPLPVVIESATYCKSVSSNELEAFVGTNRKLKFSLVLFEFIDQKGARDSDVYKKAGMDRRHFSKIRSNSSYRPSKNTVISLALALELDKNNTCQLLHSAGYALSDSDTFDLVIQFCLEKNIYDLHDVNMALDYYSLKPLAGTNN